jgi:hypothetical protein
MFYNVDGLKENWNYYESFNVSDKENTKTKNRTKRLQHGIIFFVNLFLEILVPDFSFLSYPLQWMKKIKADGK